MFREMREVGDALSNDEIVEILKKAKHGTLAVAGDDDYPYSVPINFAYADGKIMFHGSIAGHKADAMKRNNKVSFSVIAADNIVKDKFTSLFKSVIAFGKVRFVTSGEEFESCMLEIGKKFMPEYIDGYKKYMESESGNFQAGIIEIEHMTGKAGTL